MEKKKANAAEVKKIETKKTDAPKAEVKKTEAPKAEVKKTEVKKTEAPVAKTEAPKAEAKVADKPAEQKLVRGNQPADYCLTKTDWESKEVIFDATNKHCKSCQKESKATFAACENRAKFLGAEKIEAKVKKTEGKGTGVIKTRKAGPTQTAVINEMLLKKESMDAIIKKVAASFYGEGDPAKKAAKARIEGHIKSVKAGACNSSKLFKAHDLDYLNKTQQKS
jgi:hypothetical protein